MSEPVEALHIDAIQNPDLYGGMAGRNGANEVAKALTETCDSEIGRTYSAHFLQEVSIASVAAHQEAHSIAVEGLLKAIHQGSFDPNNAVLRFTIQGSTLRPEMVYPTLPNLQGLPEAASEDIYNDRRILYVGMGGGSDVIQAAAVSHVIEQRFSTSSTTGIASVRNKRRMVVGNGRRIGRATQEMNLGTRPAGKWRFLETIPLETNPGTPIFLVNDTEPDVVQSDLEALAEHTNADMIIGVDTGGDSLYKTEHAGFSAAVDTSVATPDQDAQVLGAITKFSQQNQRVLAYTAIVAPGVDSPPYAEESLRAANARWFTPDKAERRLICDLYADWRMDGSGNSEGRFGKTALAWLLALQNIHGLGVLDLPIPNVLDRTRPWRCFLTITQPMAGIALMEAKDHHAATQKR